jgi:hypothetical protein
MNINISSGFDYSEFESKVIAYKCGHRDARHAAAFLAVKYDSIIEDLLDHIENFGSDLYVERIRKEYNL